MLLYPHTRYTSRPFATVPIDKIKQVVSEAYGVPHIETVTRKTQSVVVPRFVAMFLCWCAGHSHWQIAKAFGRSDHTNSLYARKRVQFWMSESEEFTKTVYELANRSGFTLEVADA